MAHYVIHGYVGLTCTTDVKIGRVVLGICSRRDAHTDKQTNRHAHHNTTLPYRGWSKNSRLRVVPWGVPNDFTERTRWPLSAFINYIYSLTLRAYRRENARARAHVNGPLRSAGFGFEPSPIRSWRPWARYSRHMRSVWKSHRSTAPNNWLRNIAMSLYGVHLSDSVPAELSLVHSTWIELQFVIVWTVPVECACSELSDRVRYVDRDGDVDALGCVSGVRRMNEVNARRARLVLGRVTVFGWVYHLRM